VKQNRRSNYTAMSRHSSA